MNKLVETYEDINKESDGHERLSTHKTFLRTCSLAELKVIGDHLDKKIRDAIHRNETHVGI